MTDGVNVRIDGWTDADALRLFTAAAKTGAEVLYIESDTMPPGKSMLWGVPQPGQAWVVVCHPDFVPKLRERVPQAQPMPKAVTV